MKKYYKVTVVYKEATVIVLAANQNDAKKKAYERAKARIDKSQTDIEEGPTNY